MSYRELRNFKEIMCTLGYPRLISIENFKQPHFELVADILIWLCRRYDKKMEILTDIRAEHDRVAFLKSVAEQLLVKARVKLNLKNLYQANGFAVRELLKVASLLHDAHRNANADGEDVSESVVFDIGPGHKFTDMRTTRAIAADITRYGARLHQLLESHAEAKEQTSRALGKNHDISSMQKQLHRTVESAAEQTEQMDKMLGNLAQDEQNLQQKIDKKKTELDRHQKRLQSLQTVRPAFMDDFERLEAELSQHYGLYVQSHRNLAFLESELDAINGLEQEKIAESDRQLQLMQRKLREEELRILRGQAKVDERALDEALLAGVDNGGRRQMQRPGAASMRGRGGGLEGDEPGYEGGANVYGSMQGPIDDDESGEEESGELDDLGEEEDDDLDDGLGLGEEDDDEGLTGEEMSGEESGMDYDDGGLGYGMGELGEDDEDEGEFGEEDDEGEEDDF